MNILPFTRNTDNPQAVNALRTERSRCLSRDVILFSTADWDNEFWTNNQHMATELARHGFRVLYVESIGLRQPSAKGRDLRRIGRRLAKGLCPIRQVRNNIWVLSPLVIPFHGKPAVRRLNESLLVGSVGLAAGRLGFHKPMIWTYHPLIVPMLNRLERSMLVYHCVDDLTAAPNMPVEALRHSEAELVDRADAVFATSRALVTKIPSAHYFPNVADYDQFERARHPGPIPRDLKAIPRPRLGFIGAVSDYKVDFGAVAAIAKRRPDWHWVMIGQVGQGQPSTTVEQLRLPNIHLLGPRRYEVLPDYLRGFDVATVPARANDYTKAMFPMKFFEYLAAGKAVVSLNTPALNEFANACRLTQSCDDFEQALEQVLGGTVPNPELCSKLASRYTWRLRTEAMLKVLEENGGLRIAG